MPGYISLKECEDILPVQTFIRVSRFYIVNFAAIKNIAGTIEMNDGQKNQSQPRKVKRNPKTVCRLPNGNPFPVYLVKV